MEAVMSKQTTALSEEQKQFMQLYLKEFLEKEFKDKYMPLSESTPLQKNKSSVSIPENQTLLERIYHTEEAIKNQQVLMQTGFEQMDKRFEQMEKRFEENHLYMEKRFEENRIYMEKQFEQVDKRFEEIRHEMNQKFEMSDKRFQEMRHDMDKRFEMSDKRFEEMRHDMNQRFEVFDKRFEEMRTDSNNRFKNMFNLGTVGFAFMGLLVTVYKFLL